MYLFEEIVDTKVKDILPLDKFPTNYLHREMFHLITVGNPRVRTVDALIRVAKLISSKTTEEIKMMQWEEISPLLDPPYYNRSF